MKVYDDNMLSENSLIIALPSVTIGISIFALPNDIASVTKFSDGWISILIAGVIFMVLAWLAGKVAIAFPRQSFFTYSSSLVTKPVAALLVFSIGAVSVFSVAFITRSLAFISQEYIFHQTPLEALALCFLLVVTYAVSGSRAGIFRLNTLFLPIVLGVYVLVVLLSFRFVEVTHFLPLFKTDVIEYAKAIPHTLTAFSGFGILLYYISFVNKPKKVGKIVFIGIGITTLFYIMIFLTTIGIFGNATVSNLNFPTVEISKQVNIPGGILERIDVVVFTIWVMAIFNSVAILYDVAILQFLSLFKIKKIKLILVLSPIIFYIALFPRSLYQIQIINTWIGYMATGLTSFIIILLFIIALFKGVLHNDEKK